MKKKRHSTKSAACLIRPRRALRARSESEVALAKERIQALLREIVILRDRGCILRKYFEAGQCGGWRKDGKLILQAEHLNTRARNVTFADTRFIICVCKYHHQFFKQRQGQLYWRIVERHIGKERWELLQRAIADQRTYRFYLSDWLKLEVALKQELKQMVK